MIRKSASESVLGITDIGFSLSKVLCCTCEESHLLTATIFSRLVALNSFCFFLNVRCARSFLLGKRRKGQFPHSLLNRLQVWAWWQMAVHSHMSCNVQTMGLPDSMISRMFLSESIPWFIQWRCMISASRNTGSLVTLKPVLAMDMVKRFFRLKRLFVQITTLSHKKVYFFCQFLPTEITCSDWLSLWRTSIFTSVPAV